MFPSPSSSPPYLPFLSDFNSNNFPQDFSSIFLLQPRSLMNNMDQPHNTTSMADDVTKSKKQAAARKRTSKKDRHSKIYTAKGPRDRRMRLSLDVARKFFDLQDMLGFDKASRTVEWLLNQSESSIDQLVNKTLTGNGAVTTMDCCKLATTSSCSPSIITSECDMATGCDSILLGEGSRKIINSSGGSSSGAKIDVIRESRKMARARAKERTMEKMWIQSLIKKSSSSSSSVVANEDELAGQSSLMELDTRQQLGLQNNQEHDNYLLVGAAAAHTQQHLYTADLQLLTKPWQEEEEAFNNGPSYLY